LRSIADNVALVAPIGLFFGRIANFTNAELVGRTTDVPWGTVFPGDSVARHPSQLYEALLEGPMLSLLMWLARRTVRLKDGQTAALFLIAYCAARFAIEFTREPDAQFGFVAFGWITMGQLLSLVLVAVGAMVWCVSQRTIRDRVLATVSAS
jgi:phosphatidylglycerol:prolipoprotein diacylglycerol transferase